MKKVCAFIVIMLLLAAPCGAAQQEAATPLQFGTPEVVYGISAVYTVETEDVASIDVSFANVVEDYAYANFADGELRVSIASVFPLDLSSAVGEATATLNSGTQTAPSLKLKSLRFNGKKATCNLMPGEVVSSVNGEALDVSVSVRNDFPMACKIMVAAYSDTHQMLGCTIQDGDPENQDFSVDLTLLNCADAGYLKVFYLTETFQPITNAQTHPLKQS